MTKTQNIFAIKDNTLDYYERPFMAPSQAFAVRTFIDECNRDGSHLKKHPDCFSLYWLGTWDSESGRYTSPTEPQFINKATDFIDNFSNPEETTREIREAQ